MPKLVIVRPLPHPKAGGLCTLGEEVFGVYCRILRPSVAAGVTVIASCWLNQLLSSVLLMADFCQSWLATAAEVHGQSAASATQPRTAKQ